MPRDAEEIAHLYRSRVERLGPLHARMVEVRDTYNGDVVIPLPEISKHEQATVANLTQRGLDAISQRAASVLPDLHYPALRPGIKASVDKATTRRKVNYGWWEKTAIRRVMQRRARWFLGYASAPVIIRPDPKLRIPTWEPFSPLDTFPAPTRLDGMEPEDVIVRHKRTLRWLKDHYPEAAMVVHKMPECPPDAMFDVLEYIDDEEIVFVVLGHAQDDHFGSPEPATMAVTMSRLPNRAGVCWAVTPGRIALDRPIGQFDAILGMYQTQAAITAMEIIALRKTIFPDTWLVNPNTGALPYIAQEPDYEIGQPGIVVNGTIDRQQIPPNFAAGNIAARLEGAQRDTAGLPPELGGMSQSNVRTARRGSQVLGASIDFTIAEAQDAFTQSLHAENTRAIAIDKGYFNKSKSFYVSTKGQQGLVEYKPSETFEDKAEHIVSYPLAGTDLSDLVINGGQRVGMGTMSKRSFMKIDPLVDDVDAEEAQIKMEGVDAAFFAAFQEQMATPEAPWQMEQVADFAKRLAGGQVWYEAVGEINEELKKAQAEGAEPGSPETMPGLAMPGAPGAGVPSVGEPSPSMGNLTQLLNQLGSADTALAMR